MIDEQNKEMWIDPEFHINSPVSYTLDFPKYSNWTCYLFGATPGSGISYIPQEGGVPNRFVRFMMRICFDCKWVKKDL